VAQQAACIDFLHVTMMQPRAQHGKHETRAAPPQAKKKSLSDNVICYCFSYTAVDGRKHRSDPHPLRLEYYDDHVPEAQ
jgi:hypothetical protein